MIEDTLAPEIFSELRETPGILAKLLQSATDEHFSWKPAEDRWSLAEVLGHIRQIAELYHARAFYPSMGAYRNYYAPCP